MMLFRLGGDEFTILLDAVGDPSDAHAGGQETSRPRWPSPLLSNRGKCGPRLSVGIALSAATTSVPRTC